MELSHINHVTLHSGLEVWWHATSALMWTCVATVVFCVQLTL